MGIHNESGTKRVSPVPSLHDLVQQLLDLLLTTTDPERSFLNVKGSGDEVVLLVNNLGGLSELEIAAIVREVERSLGGRKVKVQRVLAGTFMVRLSQISLTLLLRLLSFVVIQTSLNMPGFSLTLLLLPTASSSGPSADLLLKLLDAPTSAPGWKWSSGTPPSSDPASQRKAAPPPSKAPGAGSAEKKIKAPNPKQFDEAVVRACKRVNEDEPEITRMDNIAGDGDCGLTLQTGANGS